MRAQTTCTAILAACLAIGVAGCGDDDGDDAASGQDAPADSGGLVVSSASFEADGAIPQQFTCDGDETSPALAFDGIPDDTAEIAVVVRDPDAGGFVHWVAGLPADTTAIDEGALPAAAVEADNGFGNPGWAGPCPPEGNHTYEFTVYALSEPSGLSAGADAEDGAGTVEDAPALATATLRGTYERG